MPITVEVPELGGTVDFPDDMSQEDIASAIGGHLENILKTGTEQALGATQKAISMSDIGLKSQDLMQRERAKEEFRRQKEESGIQGDLAAQQAAAAGYLGDVTRMVQHPIKSTLGILGYSDEPAVPPESIEYLRQKWRGLESPAVPPQTPSPAEQSIYNWENQQLSGFTTPSMGAGLAAGAGAPEIVGRGFQGMMLADIPEALRNLSEAIPSGEASQIIPGALNAVTAGALPFVIGRHLDRPGPIIPTEMEGRAPMPTGVVPPERETIPEPKGVRPVVPETPPEPQRQLSVIEEIRATGARTKEQIRELFPQLSREEAAKLRDQAWPQTTERTVPNAIETRIEQQGGVGEHTGVTPGTDIPANQPQIRQEEGGQAGGGNRPIAEPEIQGGEPVPPLTSPVTETPPLPESGITQGPGARTFTPSAKPEAAESFEGTALKNAVAELEAAGVGHDLTPAEKHAMAPLWERSKRILETDPAIGQRLADDLIANPERGMTDEDSALLLRHKVELTNALNNAAERTHIGDAEARAAADRTYVALSDDLKNLLDAVKKRGTHWGREGRWRQAMAYEDYSFATQEGLLRAAKGGRPLEAAEIEKLKADIEAHKKNAAEQEAHRVKAEATATELRARLALEAIEKETLRKSIPTFDKRILAAAERIVVGLEKAAKPSSVALREMLSRMGTSPDPTIIGHAAVVASAKIARAGLDLAKLTDEMVREYGPKIKPFMEQIWAEANNMLDRIKAPEPVKRAVRNIAASEDLEGLKAAAKEVRAEKTPRTDAQRLEALKKRATKRQAELLDRIERGDFTPKKRAQPPPLDPEGARLMTQGREIERRFEIARRRAELAQRTPAKKFVDRFVVGAYNLQRAVAVLWHGTVGMFTHAGALVYRPSVAAIWWRNFIRQFPMWLNPKYHEQLIHRMKMDPEYEGWLKSGLKIDPDKMYSDYELYNDFFSKFGQAGSKIGKVFGRISEGGARGFDSLKLARLEAAKAEWEKADPKIKADPKQADAAKHAIAEMYNKATGTDSIFGRIGKLDLSAVSHALFFAPKLYLSRWSRVLFDPIRTVATFSEGDKAPPAERYAAEVRLKHAVEFAVTYMGALAINQGLLSATGSKQKVNFGDPSKTDWLKFKAHGKNIMADGGLLDPIRLIGQIVYGDMIKDSTRQERFLKGSRFESAGKHLLNYARSKANPSLGLIVDSATQQDFTGRALPFSKEPSKYKSQKPYKWGEWILSRGPIPVSSGTRVAYDELQKRGLSKMDAAALLEGAAAAAAGMTGVHESEDYSLKRRTQIP